MKFKLRARIKRLRNFCWSDEIRLKRLDEKEENVARVYITKNFMQTTT